MSKSIPVLAVVLLCLGLPLLNARPDDADQEPKDQRLAAREAVIHLVDARSRSEATAPDEEKAIATKYDIKYVMWLFRHREKGGLGVGPTPDAVLPDGIELKLITLERKPLTDRQIEEQRGDLIRMVETTLAIAEVTGHYADTCTTPQTRPRWESSSKEMAEGTKELMKAITDGDAKAIQKSARRVNKACEACH
jgi:hypothetical protein